MSIIAANKRTSNLISPTPSTAETAVRLSSPKPCQAADARGLESMWILANYSPAPGGRGCVKNPVRDLAALVVLEERRAPEALLDAASAGREGCAYEAF
jgi:hypothetical protein